MQYKLDVDINFQAPRENLMNNLAPADASLLHGLWDRKVVRLDVAFEENTKMAKAIAKFSKKFFEHYGMSLRSECAS